MKFIMHSRQTAFVIKCNFAKILDQFQRLYCEPLKYFPYDLKNNSKY